MPSPATAATRGLMGRFFRPLLRMVDTSWKMYPVGLLFGLPILVQAWPNQTLAMTDAFYRAGSLVFGGGHVVLKS